MHPRREGSPFVFPSPTGNREQHMLDHCKEVAERADLDSEKFDLKTFRSTYATRMLRAEFDVRTVQHLMGHKSLETTIRYLVPAADVHVRLDQEPIPGGPGIESSRKSPVGEKSSGPPPRLFRKAVCVISWRRCDASSPDPIQASTQSAPEERNS